MAEELSGANERGRGVLTFLWSRLLDGVDPHAVVAAETTPEGACVL